MLQLPKKISLPGLLLFSLFFLASCSQFSPVSSRIANADKLVEKSGFIRNEIPTHNFTLLSYTNFRGSSLNSVNSKTLRVYIEGDGQAFLEHQKPPDDPTPDYALGLRLALQDNGSNVAYLGRPCQYGLTAGSEKCSPHYWSLARFSGPVIASVNEAVDVLKQQAKAEKIELIGYSGGGAVVALLSLWRDDVSRFVTVAGNLDHAYWTTSHSYTPLKYSLNAADFANQLSLIDQVHFVGSNDKNIDRGVIDSYLSKMKNTERVSVIEIDGFNHTCCWVKRWPELLEREF